MKMRQQPKQSQSAKCREVGPVIAFTLVVLMRLQLHLVVKSSNWLKERFQACGHLRVGGVVHNVNTISYHSAN